MARRPSITAVPLFLAAGLCLGLCPHALAKAKSTEPVTLGQVERIQSKILGEERTLLISLPARYDMFAERHPVMYLLDGKGNFAHVASLVRFMGRVGQIPDLIVVGIVNTDRVRDFTPTGVPKAFNGMAMTSGGAGKFIQFLEQELFPFVEKKYRTVPYRILVGHSLTAMFATHVLLTQPAMFNAYVAAGPYLTWDNKVVLKDIDKTVAALRGKALSFHVSHGGSGEAENGIDKDVATLCAALKRHAPKELSWKFRLFAADDHNSAIHPAVLDGLKHIYPDWRPVPEASMDELVGHYRMLSQRYGHMVPVPEGTLNMRGYQALIAKRTAEAIRFFEKNVELHPDSPNVYDSLGEAYQADKRLALALSNFKKAVKILSAQPKPDKRVLAVYKQHVAQAEKALAASK